MLLNLLNLLFTVYTLLLLGRIIGSWFMGYSNNPVWIFICRYTDPYLNIFRRFIPPLGNFDISPLVAFFVLKFLQSFLINILR